MAGTLKWEVFVAPGIPVVSSDLPPGETRLMWSPTASTLLFGAQDAILVDPLLTVNEAEALAIWVESHHKRLTTIYATHGHGDHCFGAGTILKHFPDARFVATPGVIKVMREQASSQTLRAFWSLLFPNQLGDRLVMAEPLIGGVLMLEGQELRVIEVGHTDTEHTTVLHVPDLGLVVAGDVAYNGVHVYLAESDHAKRREWLAALDVVDQLRPHVVIAGHKNPRNADDPRIIEETRQYIRDFDALNGVTATAPELYQQMLDLHPHRMNPGALWLSARQVKRRGRGDLAEAI